MINNIQNPTIPATSINSSNSNTQSVKKTQTIEINDGNQQQINLPNTAIALAGNLLAFTLFWTGLFVILSRMRISWQNRKTPISTDTDSNLPCSKCKFLSHNHYLRCAVNPAAVLTQEAANCADFCSHEEEGIITKK
ncbi:hypothetical protein [Brunnivagina elsteri]|uniref:Uncharacterized protein n=1 Tax=Brunnivagina elsteri CCALA 953 TaxID=987040 RepID=A0A2A2TKQ4_9CYAN|nr:hypothetical protein [Calothrix elsteri]PAX57163.1 hypothetical protein CK510_09150 [Calothrix elsteri CCALA 953]